MSAVRNTSRIVEEYVDSMLQGDYRACPKDIITEVSKVLDKSAEKTVRIYSSAVKSSLEHAPRVHKLSEIENPGHTSRKGTEIFLKDTHPFEQFIALEDYMASRAPQHRTVRLPFDSGSDGYVAYVNSCGVPQPTLMHIFIGSGKSAPKYEQWSESDPFLNPTQKKFINPLLWLENVRQPQFCAASTLKDCAYKYKIIDAEARYGQDLACVELKKQNVCFDSKQIAAGNALHFMLDKALDGFNDPDLEEKPLCKNDDISLLLGKSAKTDLSVLSSEVLEGAEKAIVEGDTTPLDEMIEKLILCSLNCSKVATPALSSLIEQRADQIEKKKK